MTRRSDNWIQTFTGKQFWPLDPRPEDIDIRDIAHGLSMICRFNGQCNRFYSVAEHSVLVARNIRNVRLGDMIEYRLRGLLHDSAEAYVSDLAKPIKRQMTGYRVMEAKLLTTILQRFDVFEWSQNYQPIKTIDQRILVDEMIQLMPNQPADWGHTVEPLGITIECWSPERAEKEFLDLFYELYDGEV